PGAVSPPVSGGASSAASAVSSTAVSSAAGSATAVFVTAVFVTTVFAIAESAWQPFPHARGPLASGGKDSPLIAASQPVSLQLCPRTQRRPGPPTPIILPSARGRLPPCSHAMVSSVSGMRWLWVTWLLLFVF